MFQINFKYVMLNDSVKDWPIFESVPVYSCFMALMMFRLIDVVFTTSYSFSIGNLVSFGVIVANLFSVICVPNLKYVVNG